MACFLGSKAATETAHHEHVNALKELDVNGHVEDRDIGALYEEVHAIAIPAHS